MAEQGVEVFAGGLVANVHDPHEVIEPNSLHLQLFMGQVDPLAPVTNRPVDSRRTTAVAGIIARGH